ncbi:uncharacterized protein LOC111636719 [Centruroides sculpturatus]|uniref:uncharacterized protein LOC111636719 n=2 Tax=Centruroides sculpturatus TaxID=218467 RepID=UPI000C6DC32B|nr:uncharacterized protein LOC111636719 [Centruroides sculpturatus]
MVCLLASMAGALFTIEQIELIRRLRSSGITKEQVVQAFEQLDRLDIELGKTNGNNVRGQHYSSPTSTSSLHSTETSTPDAGHNNSPLGITITKVTSLPTTSQVPNGMSSNSLRSETVPSMQPAFKQGEQSCSQSYSQPQSNGTSNDGISDIVSTIPPNGNVSPSPNSSITSPTSKLPSELTIIPLSNSLTQPTQSVSDGTIVNNPAMFASKSESSVGVPIQCLINPHDLLQDECNEMEELKKRGEMAILSEIRNFVMRYNIKQTMIAEMTKMSQAYVSRFFRGDIQDMSERTKNTFYMWYLTCKNNPWKLGVTNMADRPLSEREKVTLPVVNNWFNNRRKEAKKQLRQQHAAAMAAVSAALQPAGMPSVSSLGWPSSTSAAPPPTSLPPSNPLVPSIPNSAHLDLSNETADSDSSHDSQGQYDNGEMMVMELDDDDKMHVKQEI